VLENGSVLTKAVLAVDEAAYIANMKKLAAEAMAVAMRIGYATKETVKKLIAKAYREASALAESQDIMTSENVGKVLGKAEAQASALKSKVEAKK